jgi:diguanylate cyclase (GGDEF)-like protein/PAS domain S-box-containing protein
MKDENKTKEQLIKELVELRMHAKILETSKGEQSLNALRSFKKSIETMQLGLTITDLTGKIVYTNPADAKMHGYTVKELIGEDVRIFASTKPWKPMTLEQIKSMSSWSREGTNRRKDGSIFNVHLKSDVVKNDKGQPVNIITTCEDITERKRLEERLQDMLLTDELTRLHNRRGFYTLTEHHLELSKRQKIKTFLVYADLDNLKGINDTFGHQEGDSVLIETAGILKTTFRKSDIIARIGGDEFVVFPVGTTIHNVEKITARLQKKLQIQNAKKDRGYKTSLTIGIAYYDPESPCSVDELLAQADKIMYGKKKQKKS